MTSQFGFLSVVPKRSYILILRGVTVSDLTAETSITEIFDRREQFSELPKIYNGPKSWPRSIDRTCWSCDLPCDSWPRFLPENTRKWKGCFHATPVGVFCHEVCAIEHVYLTYEKSRQWDAVKLIMMIRAEFYPDEGPIAFKRGRFPKWLMARYCGNGGLTPTKWRKKMRKTIAPPNCDISSYSRHVFSPPMHHRGRGRITH